LIKQCKGGLSQEQIPTDIMSDFNAKVPYNYLQLCYNKLNDLDNATNAALTYYTSNPADEVAKTNYEWYIAAQPDFQAIDREAYNHTLKYDAGVKAYNNQEWVEVVEKMEEAVNLYIDAENECRRDCQRPFDMGWFPEFIVSISNHFTYCLKCKRNCPSKLNTVNFPPSNSDDEKPHILPQMYFYLMYAYYKVGDLRKVGGCIASHQLMDPSHTVMQQNLDYFVNEGGIDREWLVPREETVLYHHRDLYEIKLQDFIDKQFVFQPDNKFDLEEIGNQQDTGAGTTSGKSVITSLPPPQPPPTTSSRKHFYE